MHHHTHPSPQKIFRENRSVLNEGFFGNEIQGETEHLPEQGWTKDHEYWEKIQEANKDKLSALKNKNSLQTIVNTARELSEREVGSNDTLSGILKNEAGITGKALLLTLVHLKIDQNVNIDVLNIGEKISLSKKKGKLLLTISGRPNAQAVSLFPNIEEEKEDETEDKGEDSIDEDEDRIPPTPFVKKTLVKKDISPVIKITPIPLILKKKKPEKKTSEYIKEFSHDKSSLDTSSIRAFSPLELSGKKEGYFEIQLNKQNTKTHEKRYVGNIFVSEKKTDGKHSYFYKKGEKFVELKHGYAYKGIQNENGKLSFDLFLNTKNEVKEILKENVDSSDIHWIKTADKTHTQANLVIKDVQITLQLSTTGEGLVKFHTSGSKEETDRVTVRIKNESLEDFLKRTVVKFSTKKDISSSTVSESDTNSTTETNSSTPVSSAEALKTLFANRTKTLGDIIQDKANLTDPVKWEYNKYTSTATTHFIIWGEEYSLTLFEDEWNKILLTNSKNESIKESFFQTDEMFLDTEISKIYENKINEIKKTVGLNFLDNENLEDLFNHKGSDSIDIFDKINLWNIWEDSNPTQQFKTWKEKNNYGKIFSELNPSQTLKTFLEEIAKKK